MVLPPRTKAALFFRLLLLLFIHLSVSFSDDDASVMSKLLGAISPAPSDWSISKHHCSWSKVRCDNHSNVVSINLESQSIFGTLPSEITRLKSLVSFSVMRNSLSGPLPSFSNMSNLVQLFLDSNKFSSVPNDFLLGLPSLRFFSISGNGNLSPWKIPSHLIESINLGSFYASNASITGNIPDFFDSFWNLRSLNLSYNNITGNLPDSFGGSFMEVLLLNNQEQGLSGTINVLSTMIQLSQLWLHKNSFTGHIPDLSLCENLSDLQLGDNQFTGPIPEGITTLSHLQVLGISNNNLSGFLPTFSHDVRVSFTGNLFLANRNNNNNVISASASPHNSSVSPGVITGIVICFIAFVVIISLVLCKCYAYGHKGLIVRLPARKVTTNSEAKTVFPANKKDGIVVAIPIQVLEKATNSFSEENVLGSGGFGVVYMGELDDGTKVAVKRMKDGVTGTKKRMNEFQSEISFLTKVKHRNLVSLMGYCIDENEMLLVYEYMPQGTLGHHLFEWEKHGFDPLTWNQRLTIALDVGRGIEYLHSLAHQSFIHRDIKSSNILLSDDLRAKIADFGLVRKAPDGKSSVETRVAGTFGYLAPEYATTGRVTTKVDVYAFGVVLMEIITGKKAVDQTLPDDICHLVTWFRKIMSKGHNLRNVIDSTLEPDDEQIFESISKVAELATNCTSNKSFRRPDMEHVVSIVGALLQKWKPLTPEEILEDNNYGGLNIHMSLPLIMFDESSTQSLPFPNARSYGHRLTQSAQF